jgi:hypothetical protein
MANKYNLREIGVVYLDEVPQINFPTEQPFTGILGWDGSNLLVKSDNQGPVYTLVPSYSSATGTLALDPSGQTPAYAPVYSTTLGSMTVYDPNDTVVIPTYSVNTGELTLRDSNNTTYVPRTSVAAQNVAIIGSASANLNNGACVGGVYLKAGTTIDAASEAYMSSTGGGSGSLRLVDALNVLYASWTQNPASASRAGVACTLGQNPTVPADGWYELLLGVGNNTPDTVEVFGLRLVVT